MPLRQRDFSIFSASKNVYRRDGKKSMPVNQDSSTTKNGRNVTEGDAVLVIDGKKKISQWSLGFVKKKVFRERDNKIRVVEVQIGKARFLRSVQSSISLEIASWSYVCTYDFSQDIPSYTHSFQITAWRGVCYRSMKCWVVQMKAVMVFLCTREGVEFLVNIKNINFSFSIIFFFSTFHLVLRNSRWSLCEVIDLGDNGNKYVSQRRKKIGKKKT